MAGKKRIEGYWHLYYCTDCDVDFAISMLSDTDPDVVCPQCAESHCVEVAGADLVERMD
jgi:hypothetical protein